MADDREVCRSDAQPRNQLGRRRGRARRRRPHPRLQRLLRAASVDRAALGHQQLQPQLDHVHRSDLRLEPESARVVRDERHLEPVQRRPRRPAADLSGRRAGRSAILRVRLLSSVSPPYFQDGRVVVPPTFAWGSRVGERAAQRHLPRVPEHQPDPGCLDQRDEGHGAPHRQGRLLPESQLQGAEPRSRRRHPFRAALSFANDTNNPLDTTFGFANAAPGVFTSLLAELEVRRGQLPLQQHRVVPAGQLEGQQPADARLRPALRAPAAAVRRVPRSRRTSSPTCGRRRRRRAVCARLPWRGQPVRRHARQARNPVTGQLLGPNSALAIGQVVPAAAMRQRHPQAGDGIAKTNFTWPTLASRRASAWPTT